MILIFSNILNIYTIENYKFDKNLYYDKKLHNIIKYNNYHNCLNYRTYRNNRTSKKFPEIQLNSKKCISIFHVKNGKLQ